LYLMFHRGGIEGHPGYIFCALNHLKYASKRICMTLTQAACGYNHGKWLMARIL
jgi:hypothetical protein